MTRVRAAGLAIAAAALLASCAGSSRPGPSPTNAVLYGIGVSTNPNGDSSPDGFGVATGLLEGKLARIERHGRGWCLFDLSWLGPNRIVLGRRAGPACGGFVVFRYRGDHLEEMGSLPLPADVWNFAWSRDAKLIAFQRRINCGRGCTRAGRKTYVVSSDGSHRRVVARGYLAGWGPTVGSSSCSGTDATSPWTLRADGEGPCFQTGREACRSDRRTAATLPPEPRADRSESGREG